LTPLSLSLCLGFSLASHVAALVEKHPISSYFSAHARIFESESPYPLRCSSFVSIQLMLLCLVVLSPGEKTILRR
jgi:hypothetical protein